MTDKPKSCEICALCEGRVNHLISIAAIAAIERYQLVLEKDKKESNLFFAIVIFNVISVIAFFLLELKVI